MLNPDQRGARAGANERQPDVRDIIDYADRIGELARLDGADWDLEIGVLAEIFAHSNPGRAPAVLFDNIKGYPPGMRIVSGLHNTCRRLSYAFGFPEMDDPTAVVKAYRDRMKKRFPVDPAGDGARTGRSWRTSTATTPSTCSSSRCRRSTRRTAAATSAPMTS